MLPTVATQDRLEFAGIGGGPSPPGTAPTD